MCVCCVLQVVWKCDSWDPCRAELGSEILEPARAAEPPSQLHVAPAGDAGCARSRFPGGPQRGARGSLARERAGAWGSHPERSAILGGLSGIGPRFPCSLAALPGGRLVRSARSGVSPDGHWGAGFGGLRATPVPTTFLAELPAQPVSFAVQTRRGGLEGLEETGEAAAARLAEPTGGRQRTYFVLDSWSAVETA